MNIKFWKTTSYPMPKDRSKGKRRRKEAKGKAS